MRSSTPMQAQPCSCARSCKVAVSRNSYLQQCGMAQERVTTAREQNVAQVHIAEQQLQSAQTSVAARTRQEAIIQTGLQSGSARGHRAEGAPMQVGFARGLHDRACRVQRYELGEIRDEACAADEEVPMFKVDASPALRVQSASSEDRVRSMAVELREAREREESALRCPGVSRRKGGGQPRRRSASAWPRSSASPDRGDREPSERRGRRIPRGQGEAVDKAPSTWSGPVHLYFA